MLFSVLTRLPSSVFRDREGLHVLHSHGAPDRPARAARGRERDPRRRVFDRERVDERGSEGDGGETWLGAECLCGSDLGVGRLV